MAASSAKAAPCPLCRYEGATRLFESRDRVHGLPGKFTVHCCHRCAAVFYEPRLSAEELSAYYPAVYGRYRYSRSLDRKSYKQGVRRFVLENYYGYPSAKGVGSSFLKKGLAILFSFTVARDAIPYRGDGNFLDVGCGGGSYLHRLKQWGWKVYGVELSESGVQQARALGLDVRHGELVGARFPDSFFDVVRFNHVLEHLPNPEETFREVRRILRPDGIVLITVPNAHSLNFWLFGENWYGLDAPRHVICYSPKSLRVLCDATGLEIVKIRFRSGAFNFVRSVKYFLEEDGRRWRGWIRRIDWPRNRLIRRSLKPFFFLIDILGFGDIMVATLRKAKRE